MSVSTNTRSLPVVMSFSIHVAVRNPDLFGKSLGEVMALLPSGMHIAAVRRQSQNEPEKTGNDQHLQRVEADRTQRDEIEASLDLIQACPTITMVLNKQQISSRYTFGAYSSYYSS